MNFEGQNFVCTFILLPFQNHFYVYAFYKETETTYFLSLDGFPEGKDEVQIPILLMQLPRTLAPRAMVGGRMQSRAWPLGPVLT